MHVNFLSRISYIAPTPTKENRTDITLTFGQNIVNLAEAIFSVGDSYAFSVGHSTTPTDSPPTKLVTKYEASPWQWAGDLVKLAAIIAGVALGIIFPPLGFIPTCLGILLIAKCAHRLSENFLCYDEESHHELVKDLLKSLTLDSQKISLHLENSKGNDLNSFVKLNTLYTQMKKNVELVQELTERALASRMPLELHEEKNRTHASFADLQKKIREKITTTQEAILNRQKERFEQLLACQGLDDAPQFLAELRALESLSLQLEIEGLVDLKIKSGLEVVVKPVGLGNNGYICYLNSILQLFVNIPALGQRYRQTVHLGPIIANMSALGAEALARETDVPGSISPPRLDAQENLKNFLADSLRDSGFKRDGQNDAGEALVFLLGLSPTTNPSIPVGTVETSKGPEHGDGELGESSDSPANEQPAVKGVVKGQTLFRLRSEIANSDTDQKHTTEAGENCLSVGMRESLQKSIEGYFENESIDSSISKKDYLEAPPEVLIVQLKRFEMVKTTDWLTDEMILAPRKNSAKIDVDPDIEIDLERILHPSANGQAAKYHIKGVVVHIGGVSSGHYWSYVKKGADWYRCNDETVTLLSSGQIRKEINDGYIFVLEKIKMDE